LSPYIHIVFGKDIFPFVRYFKSVISTTLRMARSDHISIKYSLCSHTRGDISCTIFKENKDNYVVKSGNLRRFFLFGDRWLSWIKRKLVTREKKHLYGMFYPICFSCVFGPIRLYCRHLMLYSCITAASQSDTSYTAVYTGVGSFVVTALMSVIIVLATLRSDFIVFIIYFIFSWTANTNKDNKGGHVTSSCWFISSRIKTAPGGSMS